LYTPGHPKAESGVIEHDDLIKRVTGCIHDSRAEKQLLSGEIVHYLCDWLINSSN
jgi:hypothetical protein